MPLIRSISGLRATLGTDLTPECVTRHAAAFAAFCPPGTLIIGRDGRPSGEWIQDILVGTLRACGRSVRLLEMVPTPTVQLEVEHSDASGGIVITASHNPEQWNGLKFLGSDGVFLGPAQCAMLWCLADEAATSLQHSQQAGSVVRVTAATDNHIERVMSLPAVSRGITSGQTVVVDAVNASGSVCVPQLLERLGYNVVRLHCNSSGIFPHTPEPIPENLGQLCDAVREHAAAFGVAVDPDADRLVLVDHTGTPIGEEYTVTLATYQVLEHAQGQPSAIQPTVTVNYSTTRMVNDVAAMFGATTHRSAVGEINVVQCMREQHSIIGGEGSGGVIYPACHSGRDSIVALALIVSLLQRHGWTLREACSAVPSYTMIKTKVDRNPEMPVSRILDHCASVFANENPSREDGVHVAWSDRWVHVRASNTEPILRIIAEAPTSADALDLISTVRQCLEHA